MMGQAVSSLDIPVTKGTTGVIAFTRRETKYLADKNNIRAFAAAIASMPVRFF